MNLFKGCITGLIFCVGFASCKRKIHVVEETDVIKSKDQIKGFNFTGTSYEIERFGAFDSLVALGSNYISFSPFSYMNNGREGRLVEKFPGQWTGESVKGISTYIDSAHSRGLKVLINPHIWIVDGTFTGDLDVNESERKIWQENYARFILKWAEISETKKVEMFSLGNELKTPIADDLEYWLALIKKIRRVYSGKLTYAANWDNLNKVSFWRELDVVSVNAYFPLSTSKIPRKKEIEEGWVKWKEQLKSIKNKYRKPLIFTEIGYESVEECCKEPWNYKSNYEANEECQANAFSVFFEDVMGSVCDGVFIWKWYDVDDIHHSDKYSPQSKKSLDVIRKGFFKGTNLDLN